MSHFAVGIICKELNDLEKLLAPYQENNMGDVSKEYLVFNSITEEEKQRYETSTKTMFVTLDGRYLYPWNECFDVEITKEEYAETKGNRSMTWDYENKVYRYYKVDHSIMDGELKEISYKDIYPTFEEYMKSSGETKDKEMNDYGYWENPNAKWDWYLVGGRWSNIVALKNGNKENYAKIKDINFGVDSKEYKKHERFWEIVVEEQPLKDGEEKPSNWLKKEYYLKKYKDKNDYATKNSKFGTYALITPDGKWFEQGEMGWWGIDSSTQESIKDYEQIFCEVVRKEEYQDYYFVVVDCHI